MAARLGMVAAVNCPALERIGHVGYRRHPVRRWQLHHRVTKTGGMALQSSHKKGSAQETVIHSDSVGSIFRFMVHAKNNN